jgi:pyruvate dehydrogenase E2 component (dihydrolipoamide acetyltransferase)
VVAEGTDDVAVGTVIALIGSGDGGVAARLTDISADVAGPALAAPEPQPAAAEPQPRPLAAEPQSRSTAAEPEPQAAAPERRKISPLARRIAQSKGIDLGRITGSGAGGKVVLADLGLPERAVPAIAAAPVAMAAPIHAPPAGIPHETVKLSGMRKTIARRLTEAKQTVPHFYLSVDVRLDALLKLRGELNAARQEAAGKLSVNDFLIKALARALEETPDANVQFGGEQLYRFKRVDIAMAVAVPGGLVTPVLTDAGGKRLSRLAAEARELAARARAGKLAPEEYQGGTASLSNLGMFGMKEIIPVLSPPQAVIIGVGAGEQRPYVVGGELSIATILTATGSFDHRAIDGATGAQLMQNLKQLLEQPLDILV